MRVLWVTPQHPDPAGSGGAAHEYELLRLAARAHEIQLLSTHPAPPPGESALPGLGVEWEAIESRSRPYPRNKAEVSLAMLRATPTLYLWTFRDRWVQAAKAVERVAARFRPDLVHVSLGELAPALAAAPGRSALLLFDSYTRQVERKLDLETLPRRRLQWRVEQRRAAQWERRWYRRASALASVSAVDADRFRSLLDRPVAVVENPIGEAFFAPPTVARRGDTVTFVGSLLHPPNTDAIEWLAGEIWPLVRARVPDARLVVAGRGDGDLVTVPRIRALVEAAGGSVAVDVADMRPHYWESAVVIAPIRLGAGLRNKVIHAMACRAPVVATEVALEGIRVRPGDDVLVGATAAELADHVVATLRDPAEATRRVDAAAEAMERYRADAISERFEAWWRSAVA